MKRKLVFILRLAMLAVVTSILGFVATVDAQDTSISDNPHLRKKDAPANAAPASGKLSEKDQKFIQAAANGGAAEVADGKLAENKGKSGEVKMIGARMVADHSKANNQLVALAKKKGLSLDPSKGKPRPFDMANLDRQYLVSMEKDHEMDIKLFEKEASSGDDADLKAWAAKTLPTLKAHLAMVKDARKKIK